MAYLRNKGADMEIGFSTICGKCMLYVRRGNRVRYFGTFTDEARALDFMEVLLIWDENGRRR